mgnify:FL=1
MDIIELEGFKIEVIRKNIEYMRILIHKPSPKFRIEAPTNFKEEEILVYAISKISWMKSNQHKIKKLK